jgi:L-asparaginase II
VSNPVSAIVYRAGRPESLHRGFGAVADARGLLRARFGDPETPVYWRSAAKPFQAMPFMEAGGESRFGLSLPEIALACASHDGEPIHVETARAMLAKGGFSEADLRCGAHPPYDDASAADLIARGEKPTPLHNNCSGKHAAMLLACKLFGFDPATYDSPDHPLQRKILGKIAFYADYPESSIEIGVDGCSLPVFRLPISRLATAYARLLSPGEIPGEAEPARAARRRIVEAMTGCPVFVSGSRQFTSRFIEAGGGRWIGKEGAEGVYAIGLADGGGTGIAYKIEDGSGRARYAVGLDILRKICGEAGSNGALAEYARPQLRNARGLEVGEIVAEVPLEMLS